MRNNHALFHRNHGGAWVLALALGCLSLSVDAASINRGNIGRMGITQTGRTTTLTPGAAPTNSGGSTIPISPSIGGWTTAGNYGSPTAATGPTAGINFNGSFIVGGSGAVKYPVSGSYAIPWNTIAGAAATAVCVLGTAGACGIASAAAAAAPYVMDWLARAGLRRNPTTGEVEQRDTSVPAYADWRASKPVPSQGFGPYSPTRGGACSAIAADVNAYMISLGYASGRVELKVGSNSCQMYATFKTTGVEATNGTVNLQQYTGTSGTPSWLPISMNDIAPYMKDITPDGRVWGELIDKGVSFDMPDPTVTGPSVIQGPETVTQNADGTKSVTSTKYNFQTSGNTITNTSNVTTTNNYNSSNTQTSTTTTTTTPTDTTPGVQQPQEEQKSACEKDPLALGCQHIDFDTPDGQIPKETKDVTFTAESVLGGGSCPADVYTNITSTGQNLKVWDWQATCNYFLPIRFILMACAAFSAVLIIMPGGGKTA